MDAYAFGELDEFFDCPRPPQTIRPSEAFSRPRAELAAALAAEAGRLGAHSRVIAAAGRLADERSAAVVTGQQAGLLLGPNFTLSKLFTARHIAARIDTDEAPVVPVFWLASQDHDTAEIDHAWLLDLDERLHRMKLELPSDVPTGLIPWQNAWLTDLLGQLRSGNWQAEFLEGIEQQLGEAAAVSESWADFFAALFYRVLGPDAPLVLDPTRPGLAPLFSSVLAREIEDPQASVEAINSAGARLSRLGHSPQLGRGHLSTNLFISTTQDGLPRRRLLRFDAGTFSAGEERFSRADLLAMLDSEPGRITPAAGLRPVVQDAVVPTSAFVVGPGELRYLAQTRDVYRHHGVTQPTIWPRAEVTLLEPPAVRILSKLGVSAADYQADPESIERQLLLEQSGAAREFSAGLHSLRQAQAELKAALLKIDPTLSGAVDRHAQRVAHSLGTLEQKTAAATRRRESVLDGQFERLRAQLLPAGGLQERVLSPVSFFLKFGSGPVLRRFAEIGESGPHLLEL